MTNKELIELAAKAAGKHHMKWEDTPFWEGLVGETHIKDEAGFPISIREEWNPIDNDGDRYRLALATKLFSINKGLLDKWTSYNVIELSMPFDYAFSMAIVRAAAEIGRAMP